MLPYIRVYLDFWNERSVESFLREQEIPLKVMVELGKYLKSTINNK